MERPAELLPDQRQHAQFDVGNVFPHLKWVVHVQIGHPGIRWLVVVRRPVDIQFESIKFDFYKIALDESYINGKSDYTTALKVLVRRDVYAFGVADLKTQKNTKNMNFKGKFKKKYKFSS